MQNKKPRKKHKQRHGYWEVYNSDTHLSFKGLFINDIKFGVHKHYWGGDLIYKCNYINDKRHGYREENWIGETIKEYYAL
jgi:antitoxin component YwqK of YwqJK toxin-antitoxin module